MITFQYTIKDELGIHARPAGMLVKEAKKYESKIKIKKDSREVSASQLLGLMSLSVKCKDGITVIIEGSDEEIAAEKMKQFFEENL